MVAGVDSLDYTMRPTADGTHQEWLWRGPQFAYQAIDEGPELDDNDWIENRSGAVHQGERSTFKTVYSGSDVALFSFVDINGYWAGPFNAGIGDPDLQFEYLIIENGNEILTAPITLLTDPNIPILISHRFPTPDFKTKTSDWLEIGVRRTDDGLGGIQCYQLWAELRQRLNRRRGPRWV